MWPSTTPPEGFLLCDGSEYSSTEEDGKYKELYDIIGTTFGVGSSADSFKVPDCRERFIEGASSTKSVGDKFDAKIPVHKHSFTGTAATSTSQGSHTHTRGDMSFYGSVKHWAYSNGSEGQTIGEKSGVFTSTRLGSDSWGVSYGGNAGGTQRLTFNANNGWSGSSSEVGNHSHAFTAKGTLDNASAHNSVYGKSTTVQPAAVAMNYVIRYK